MVSTALQVIPNCVPFIVGNEVEYLKEAVETGWLSSAGPFVDRFESVFADYHNVPSAAALSSGTAAIHLGLISLGVGPEDLVLCPTLTFVATVNPIRYCGADPVFLDVEDETLCLDPQCLSDFLAKDTETRESGLFHKTSGRRIAAMIVVHLYGNPAPMQPILELSRKYGLPVLEDAAESLGARYQGQLVGTLGDVGCFSFNGNKIITTGGGGMIISKQPETVSLCKHLSTQAKSDPVEFIHDQVGYNYRLSNLAAAVGTAQMEHLENFVARKRANASCYTAVLSQGGQWSILSELKACRGTYWMVVARSSARHDVQTVQEKVRLWSRQGIGVRPIWYPLHKFPIYRDAFYYGGKRAETAYHRSICLPSSVGLSEIEISRVAEVIEA